MATGQPEQNLLVDGAIGAMQEPVSGRVIQQDRQVRMPIGNGTTDQRVRVVPQEVTPFPEVRREQAAGASRGSGADRHEQGRRQPDAEPIPRPPTGDGYDLLGSGQLVGWRREMERQPFGRRLERQAYDRVRHVVHRHDVDAKPATRGDDAELAGQQQSQGLVERIERLDVPGPGVADDHRGPHDRDRELGRRRANQALALELRLLVRAREAEGVGQVVLAHRARPTARHVGRGHVHEAREPADRSARSPARGPPHRRSSRAAPRRTPRHADRRQRGRSWVTRSQRSASIRGSRPSRGFVTSPATARMRVPSAERRSG